MRIIKTIILTIMALMLINTVFAVNTAIIIEFPDGTSRQECIYVRDGGSAQDAIKTLPGLLDYWDSYGNLTKISDWESDPVRKSWLFFNNNGNSNDFAFSTTRWSSYIIREQGIREQGHVIGAIFTNFTYITNPDNSTSYVPAEMPAFVPYSTICKEMLKVEEITVFVDKKEETGADLTGGLINDDVRPESVIKIEIEVKNLYTSSEDIVIGDVYAKAVLERIDDGEDIEAETKTIDLDAGDSRDLILELKIPLRVYEKNYRLKLTVNGEDDKNLVYTKEYEFEVEIRKERHKIKIIKAELSPEEISCYKRVNVDLEILNIGKKEELTELWIVNDELGIDYYTNFTLDSDPYDSSNDYKTMLTFNLDNDVLAGIYQIDVKIKYDNTKTETRTLNLEIFECADSGSRTSTSTERPKTTPAPAVDEVEVIIRSSANQTALQNKDNLNGFMAVLITVLITFLVAGIGVILIVIGYNSLVR